MSLRLRLVVGLAALVLGGLFVFGAGTYLSLRHFLVGRLDNELTTAAAAVAQAQHPTHGTTGGAPVAGDGDHGSDLDDNAIRRFAGPDLYVAVYDTGGEVSHATPASTDTGAKPPRLSAAALTGALSTGHTRVIDAKPVGGGQSERVAIIALSDGGRAVVAGSLRPVDTTLGQLVAIEAAAGGVVLLVTLGLGLTLASMATRPLEDIAVAADAIAAGDLDRRVAVRSPATEAGRVGAAFNAMLTEIQQAFARRDATERRLRRFVADASHELSTPLTSIRGYAELFHRGLAEHPDDLATAMGRIEAESTRMGRLVDDLLDLAKVDSGRPLELRPVDLATVAAEGADDLRAVSHERPVTVDAPAPVRVLGDDDRVRQIVANLTSNAHRYTPPDTPVTLRAFVDGDGADAAGVIEVADEGPGLTDEQASHAFDRFYRVDDARAREQGGSGLGLAIVASLAEAMGGSASVVTSPGAGCAFRVRLPLAPAAGHVSS